MDRVKALLSALFSLALGGANLGNAAAAESLDVKPSAGFMLTEKDENQSHTKMEGLTGHGFLVPYSIYSG